MSTETYCDDAFYVQRFWDQVPLKRAVEWDHYEIAEFICQSGADIEAESYVRVQFECDQDSQLHNGLVIYLQVPLIPYIFSIWHGPKACQLASPSILYGGNMGYRRYGDWPGECLRPLDVLFAAEH